MEITKDMTIKEILDKNKNTLRIFMKYGIDACCRSHNTLEKESRRQKVDVDKVIEDLKKLMGGE